jgi:hypothetical protein
MTAKLQLLPTHHNKTDNENIDDDEKKKDKKQPEHTLTINDQNVIIKKKSWTCSIDECITVTLYLFCFIIILWIVIWSFQTLVEYGKRNFDPAKCLITKIKKKNCCLAYNTTTIIPPTFEDQKNVSNLIVEEGSGFSLSYI